MNTTPTILRVPRTGRDMHVHFDRGHGPEHVLIPGTASKREAIRQATTYFVARGYAAPQAPAVVTA